jgi:hypothetical protein
MTLGDVVITAVRTMKKRPRIETSGARRAKPGGSKPVKAQKAPAIDRDRWQAAWDEAVRELDCRVLNRHEVSLMRGLAEACAAMEDGGGAMSEVVEGRVMRAMKSGKCRPEMMMIVVGCLLTFSHAYHGNNEPD